MLEDILHLHIYCFNRAYVVRDLVFTGHFMMERLMLFTSVDNKANNYCLRDTLLDLFSRVCCGHRLSVAVELVIIGHLKKLSVGGAYVCE